MSFLSRAWKVIKAKFSDEPPGKVSTPCLRGANEQWQQAAKDVFPGQQSYQNCGLQSSRQLIEQAKGQRLAKSELEFLEDAIETCGANKEEPHPAESGGSNAAQRKCVMAQYGVASSVQDASVEAVEKALREGKGVVMSGDMEVLWANLGLPEQSGRHAVVLTHADFDENGELVAVYVNDTGVNQRYQLSRDELEDALDSGSGQLNVTDEPIWPGA